MGQPERLVPRVRSYRSRLTDNLATAFTIDVNIALDHFFPTKTVRFHPTDKPWITAHIKELTKKRQQAFHCSNTQMWRIYRRKVQKAISDRKKNFYAEKVRNTRKDDVRQWWRTVNAMFGRSRSSSQFTLERDGVPVLSESELAACLNHYFANVARDIPPLDMSSLPAYLPPNEREPLVHPHEVCKNRLSVQPNKAMGPDNIPPRIIKEFAYELSEPVTTIFNSSLSAGVVPNIWKESNVSPILKV